jgi:hypothetical protein
MSTELPPLEPELPLELPPLPPELLLLLLLLLPQALTPTTAPAIRQAVMAVRRLRMLLLSMSNGGLPGPRAGNLIGAPD